MSDTLKAQKLAAARKRLKEYQKTQSDKKVVKNDENMGIPQKNQILELDDELLIPVAKTIESSSETKYFNTSLFENDKLNTNYFDKNLFEQSNQSTSNQNECETVVPTESNLNSPNSALEIFSNTESLRQISNQLNSLLDHEVSQNFSESSLETRNQELNSLLKSEKLKNEQLNLQMQEYISRISQLESEISMIKAESHEQLNKEMMSLQKQLKNYVETVGILVGEKTELTMALNQSQTTAKQKTVESEELQGRLKASRHRVSELEKELNYLKSFKDNIDKSKQENNRELEKLRLEFNLLKDQLQNNAEELIELREKLTSKTNENLVLQQDLQNKNSQLSLTELKLKQLTDGENFEIEKTTFQHQIAELTQKLIDLNDEKSQENQKYIQYVRQLNTQIKNLTENLDQKNLELENYACREQSLIKHISELERNLQKPEPEINFVAQKKLEETIENLLKEKNEMEIKYQQEKSEFEKKIEHHLLEIQQKNEKIVELENEREQFVEQPDVKKLLATMESDKIAASRAVEQNKKLKQQLDELQQGFIEMSNNKLELTEKLQSEQFKLKEISETNTKHSSTIEHLHTVISTKDKELTDLHQTITNLQKQNFLQTQQLDRLGHYEAQDNVSAILQQEICELKAKINKLTLENNNLNPKLSDSVDNLDNCSAKNKINREKAMEQLEERFKKTMADVANLTEEKQRLEHLVLQLQSETETIGEYITLYQCQRAILKEKSLEKDEQLKKLSKDKHEMKKKLEELNNLLQILLPEDKKQEKMFSTDNNNDNSLPTAEKIISLLDEIQKSDLVQPTENYQNFHPCPLCSGQLITV